jgi:hypothetical protein
MEIVFFWNSIKFIKITIKSLNFFLLKLVFFKTSFLYRFIRNHTKTDRETTKIEKMENFNELASFSNW